MTSSVDEQIKRVAGFHALPENVPARSLEDWRKLVSGWKARMSVSVVVGELRQLLDELEHLRKDVK